MSAEGVDLKRRRFLTATASIVGGVGVVAVAVPFISSMEPSARAQAAGAPVEADISKLEPGQMIPCRGAASRCGSSIAPRRCWRHCRRWTISCVDPQSNESEQPKNCKNEYRSIKPEYPGDGRHLHPPRLLADVSSRLGARRSGSGLERRILLSLPRFPLRSRRPCLQGCAGAAEPGGAAVSLSERDPMS